MRIDYDRIAESYDDQPYRSKEADTFLMQFADEVGRQVRAIDVACGTGNQQIANGAVLPDAERVGVDASRGMLEVARRKSGDVVWIRAAAEALPFSDDSFDYVSCQFAYHHFGDHEQAFREMHRVLADGGRLVCSNVSPHDYSNSLFYRVFPPAWERDRHDFLSTEELRGVLRAVGFDRVGIERERVGDGETLGQFLEYVSVRTNNSHLTALDDDAWARGVALVRQMIEERGPDTPAGNPVVLVTAIADV